MSKAKDLGKAVVLALGLTGLVASVSSCVPMVAAGAGAYAGTKMAQKDNRSQYQMIEVVDNYGKICYRENGSDHCVCGSEIYRNDQARYLLMEGASYSINHCTPDYGSYDPSCTECLDERETRIFPFEMVHKIKIRRVMDFKDPSSPFFNPELAQANK